MKRFIVLISFLLPSTIRISLLRFAGFDIARDARLKPFSIILADHIVMEKNTSIDSFTVIAGLKSLILKKSSAVSRFTYISGKNELILGERSLIGSRCIINLGSGDVIFGEYSVLAPRSTIYTHGTFLPVTHGYSGKNKGVQIGSYTWIMQSTSIGPGVKIGSKSIILPGSTIVKGIQDNVVVYDTPVDRKSFPADLFKKELSNDDLETLIREIAISYSSFLLNNRKILDFDSNEERVLLMTRKGKIEVHFGLTNNFEETSFDKNVRHCFFGQNVEDNLILNDRYFILDFLKIRKSLCKPPKEMTDIEKYMFYEYGLKFI